MADKRFVVVTTEHRGVFGGYLNGSDDKSKTVELTDAHMCVYWHASVKGVLGLATTGQMTDGLLVGDCRGAGR